MMAKASFIPQKINGRNNGVPSDSGIRPHSVGTTQWPDIDMGRTFSAASKLFCSFAPSIHPRPQNVSLLPVVLA